MPQPNLSYCGDLVRQNDPDRFLTSLFAPSGEREVIWSLLAFNHEIAKTREVVSEPTIGHIRLQWWRDSIAEAFAGEPKQHEVLEPLARHARTYGWDQALFDALIDARERDLEATSPTDVPALVDYASATTRPLILLICQTLGGNIDDGNIKQAAHHAGVAHALTGIMRAMAYYLNEQRQMLPEDLLADQSLTASRVSDFPHDERLKPVIMQLAGEARQHLTAARDLRPWVPRRLTPAFLPATLAMLGLRQLAKAGYDPFDMRVISAHPHQALSLSWRAPLGLW
tara:strand:- start:466 stop:1317 length:852 start_codon:yes stop_codon:yes gene_type:complete